MILNFEGIETKDLTQDPQIMEDFRAKRTYQPMRRFPVSLVPSVNVAVTFSAVVEIEARRLPH